MSGVYLYKFDFLSLFLNEVKNGKLTFNKKRCDIERELINKGDSLLFEQIRKITNDECLSDKIVIIDFTRFLEEKHTLEELKEIPNGIDVSVKKVNSLGEEISDEITINVKDFLRSSSMAKEKQMYYILSEPPFYNAIMERCLFQFDKKKNSLAKLFAYSGLFCSDCILLPNIKIKRGELIVIKDKIRPHNIQECITAVSALSIYDLIKSFSNNKDKNSIDYKKLQSYISSSSYLSEEIEKDWKAILKRFSESEKNNFNDIKLILDDYSFLGTTNKEIEWTTIKVTNYPSEINLFDGEGLISKEFAKELNEQLKNDYQSSSFQIRLPYIKGMVHSCDFKSFYKSKGISHIRCLDGNDYPIENVKMIINESMFKAIKFYAETLEKKEMFYEDYFKRMDEYNYSFGVVGFNKKEKRRVRLEYQFLSTLPLNEDEVGVLLDNEKHYTYDAIKSDKIIENLKNEIAIKNSKNISDLSLQHEINLSTNHFKEFYSKTERYHRRQTDIFYSRKEASSFCKFEVIGDRRYLSGDLLEYLYWTIDWNKDDGYLFDEDFKLKDNSFFMPTSSSYIDNAVLLRSPHYSRNEIGFGYRVNDNLERNIYFNHLKGIIMINPLSLIAERLGGADYDGDTIVVCNEKCIVDEVKKNILNKYSIIKIPSLLSKKKEFTYENRLNCLQETFSSRIGQISNRAFIDAVNEYSKKIVDEEKIATYTILSGLEIDSVKNGRKPKLPSNFNKKELRKNNENSFLNLINYLSLYLEAKKESDNSNKKEKNKELEDFQFETNNLIVINLHKIFVESRKLEFPSYEKIKISKTKCNIDSEVKMKVFVICSLYSRMNSIINRVLSKNAKKNQLKKIDKYYNLILGSIITNKDELDELIDAIKVDNLKANDLINEYISTPEEKKYHYLSNRNDREKFLLDSLKLELNNKSKELLTNFDNEGYRLLFLILNILSKKISVIKICEKSIKYIDDIIDNAEENLKNYYNKSYLRLKTEFEEMIKENISTDCDSLKDKIISRLKEECKEITYEDIKDVIDIYSCSLIFDVFYEQMLSYLEEVPCNV